MDTTAAHAPAEPVVAALTEGLGPDVVSTDPGLLDQVAHDRSSHSWEPALAVVRPRSTEDVAAAVGICAEHNVPVVPRGAGTGLEGGANTSAASISVDLSTMNQITQIAADDMYVRVQAGVMKSVLNTALAAHDLHFPVGPGVDASLGGMAATSASGTTAVSHGTLKENVIGLTAVLADGSVITTGSTTKKTSAGYDLTHLLVGSEGTLGIITEVTVTLHPVPQTTMMGIWSLPSLGAAADLVVASLRSSLRLARVELLDDATVEALAAYSDYRAPVAHTLMVEFAGHGPEVSAQYAQFAALAETFAATELAASADPNESAELWQARHDALPAAMALVTGCTVIPTDVCVPISQLPQCILQTQEDVRASGLIAPIVGHVGDGNFHVAIVVPPQDHDAAFRASQLAARLVDRALAMGGTCTGEHGVGTGKVGALAKEHASSLAAMRAIKSALDPHGIMNPGKVLST
ncbi:MAG: FAD-binding oxidoreductase [Nesterenkonia sp.]